MAQHASDTMKIAEQYLTEALKQLYAEHSLRTMHVDIAISDTDSSRTVGRVNLRRRGEQGTLTMSAHLDECTQGELLLLAGSALALYGQATDALAATDDDTEEK